MGYKSTKQIKVPEYEEEKRLLKAVEQKPVDNRIVFSFSFFQKHSIRLGDFNNFYPNINSSLKAVSDFFETITLISKYEKSHFFSPETKKQFHYNEFTDNDIIDKIENILIRGYNMPRQKVDQFERLFFEFSFYDGKRVIGTKIYGNLFEILFIDCNHMICKDSSRNLKMKEVYKVPSAFKKENLSEDVEEYGKMELIEMLVGMGRSGFYGTIEEFIKDFDDLLEKV